MSTVSLSPANTDDFPTNPLRLDAESNGMSMTPEEFDAVDDYDECYRYELVRGVVIVTPIPNEPHEASGDELAGLLWEYSRRRPGAIDETLPNRYLRTSAGRRLADRVIWAGLGRRPDPKKDVPTIAVEFVSKSRRDRHRDYVEKRQEYRDAGVKEYWIIDRFRRQMTVVFADGSERIIPEEVIYTTPLLPRFDLPLKTILARADQWEEGTS